MCARTIASHLKQQLVLGFFVTCLVANACGTVASNSPANSSATADRIAADLTRHRELTTSTADQFNQSLFAVPSRELAHSPDYPIGPQDAVEVNLFNIGGSDGLPNKVQVRVGNNGIITLPLLGQVQVAGLTRTELEESLRQKYAEFMHDPDVGVSLAENRSMSVYVLGAVKSPGVYAVTGHERLRRVLAMAGGLTTEAGMTVHVSRETTEGEQAYIIGISELANDQSGNLDVAVRPGDFVNVPRAGSFYVDGHVARPNAYALSRPYTLTQALTIAGGLDQYAKSSDITLIRRGPGQEVKVFNRDLQKIRTGEEEDITIAENDVIVVPASAGKIVLSTVLGMFGYTARTAGATVTFGRSSWASRGVPMLID